ncbi:MAG: hypothetical protein WCB26_20375 [Pseudolabrys sp.]
MFDQDGHPVVPTCESRAGARSVIDRREHDGTLAAEGRQSTSMRHIAVYVRILTRKRLACHV